MMARYPKKISA